MAEEPGRLQSMGLQRVRHNSVTQHTTAHGIYLGFPDGASGKEPACQCRRLKGRKFHP